MSAGIFSPPFFPTGGSPLPTSTTVFQPQQPADSPPTSTPSNSSSIVIVVIVIASAVIVSASIYLLLRLMSRGCSRTHDAAEDVISSSAAAAARRPSLEAVEALPLFTFGSVTGNLTGADCAVCLSKFVAHDRLRLLPLCCHAFHAQCIDAWLSANQSCPLCRSPVYPTEADVLRKILSVSNDRGNANSGSFRVEIGSISRRRGGDPASAAGNSQRSYSVGSSLEYVVDDGREVSVQSIHRRVASECTDKESIGAPVPESPGDNLAREVSRGRSWLREYVDRIASFSVSSRTISGRFFGGSSRRSDVVVPIDDDLEAGRVGEEISEMFRWLSAV
ncbi:unnamed protein product [Cuscuta campestris]|uniref:RING-type domain-containing protein n=1 Tax=Cuscuta campestris TaxID=132261 RepID=A0A484LHK3_9ASTE|nr:unnamed protein product [Cuscuta campestris]